MSALSSQSRRNLVVIFITLLLIFEVVAYVATTPRPSEQFFQLYVLGADRKASDYYPKGTSNIGLGDAVRWYLGVTNFMGNVQLITIRLKLGNQTVKSPDDLSAQPSPAPTIAEFTRFLLNNETWEFPLVWQITNASNLGGSIRIIQLRINNTSYNLQDTSSINGYNFRFIIELWSWNTKIANWQFGWLTGTENRVAWLQVWFNATSIPG